MGNILSLTAFIPMVGAVILALFLRGDDKAAQQNAKWVALATTVFTFIVSLFILFGFDPSNPQMQFVEERPWIAALQYRMGIDGVSLPFVMLTTFLMPLTIAACWNVTHRVKEYMIAFLVLETMTLGVFMALDLVLFYLFLEAGLIPMFIIIGIWGGKDRIYATFKFFLYTFFGSVIMLIAMVAMFVQTGTACIAGCGEGDVALYTFQFASETISIAGVQVVGGVQTLMFLAFFISFAVKMPMWPFHTWLPDAHVQAPTAGSVILAAVLLKLGGYGMLRFNLPMFPVASEIWAPMILWMSAIAIVYASLVALVQTDIKKVIAYSSVAHMGFVTMGIFAMNQQGIDGAMFQMVSHGIVSGALFLCVGVIYDRMHTREVDAYGGLVIRMPAYAAVFMLFTMANVGLPGTSGFVGEFLPLMGVFQVNTWVAVVATSGVILSAAYALWLYRRVVFGDLIKESLKSINDMDRRERLIFAPLVVGTLLFGVYPSLLTDVFSPTVTHLIDKVELAQADHAAGMAVAEVLPAHEGE